MHTGQTKRPAGRLRWVSVIATIAVAFGCGADDTRYCTADEDCPSGRCALGLCAPPDAAAGDAAAPLDAAPDDGTPPAPDAAPDTAPDDGVRLDGAVPDAGRADGAVDGAPPEACVGDAVWFERCDADRVRRAQCVQGAVQSGPCRAIPPAPCGAVCEGCGVEGDIADGVTRRQAYVLLAAAAVDLGPFDPPATAERCSGCRWGYTGFTDETCRIERDDEGRPGRRTCLYCARDQTETTTFASGPERLESRTTCGPDGRVTGELAYVLDGRGGLERIELADGAVHALAGPGGLLAALETRDGAGAVRARWTFERGEDGRLLEGVLTNGFDGVVLRRERYDYGCWQCDDDRCRLAAPVGCVAVPGALPPVHLCGPGARACPEGLEPAWVEDFAEAAWILNGVEGAEPWVGARRVDGAYIWSANGAAVPEALLPPPGAQGECAVLGATAEPVAIVGHTGQRHPQLAPRPCDDGAARMTLCRAR